MRKGKPHSSSTGTQHRKGAASFRFRAVIMAKEPVLGRVKTRLGREIGAAHATRFYRSTAAAVLDRLRHDRRFETILGVAPDTASRSRAFGAAPLRRIPQGNGGLGERMLRLAETAPPGPVVIAGTDIPGITPAHLADAFRLLGNHDVVVGPADDGGFWLIGFARRRPIPQAIFKGVRWSHPDTFADVLANCRGLRVGRAAVLPDVDTEVDYRQQSLLIGRHILPITTRLRAGHPM